MQGCFQDVRDHEIKARAPMIWRFAAELDFNPVSVQVCVRLGTRQRDGIDVCPDEELSTASSGDPGQDSRTSSYVQHRFHLPPPAKQVHG
jgi:hypothetical protein